MVRNATTARRRRNGGGSEARGVESTTNNGGATSRQQGNTAQQTPTPSVRDALRQALVRSLLMYAMYKYYWKKPSSEPTEAAMSGSTASVATPATPASPLASLFGGASQDAPPYYAKKVANAWPPGAPLEFRVFTSLSPNMTFLEAQALGASAAVWSGSRVRFATVGDSYLAKNVTLGVPESVREGNSTWYAHIFVGLGNVWQFTEPSEELVDKGVLYARHDFVKWLDVDLTKKDLKLLGRGTDGNDGKGGEDQDRSGAGTSGLGVEHIDELEVKNKKVVDGKQKVRYDQVWKPTMPIVAVTATGPLILKQLPVTAAEAFRVDEERLEYYPPMHVNEFWMLRNSLELMNETVKEVTVEMSFSPISLYKWSMYKQFDSVWQKQIDFGAMAPSEPDELKRMFIETNPWLLGTTLFVSTAHTVLEVLAFKNDISHWKNIKTMEGVSVRTMMWKIVMEAIIFMYLWDNDTSWIITVGNGVGLAIAIWKLGKAVKFENVGKRKLFGFIPWFDMADRESYSKKTKEYDDQAMKYLGYVLYPLVALYALYSLKYEKHKSWYSWVINSLVGAVYAFGFIMLFPQIFINYKLKSVAHMPMKAMMYKTLNTIIDDLFSFIIKMPWLHRLACFRDDVVFLILLYQRWIYPVDTKRVNEFGQQFDDDGEEKAPSAEGASESDVGNTPVQNNVVAPAGAEEQTAKGADEKKND